MSQADKSLPKLWGRSPGQLQSLLPYCYNISSAKCGSADLGPEAPSVACNGSFAQSLDHGALVSTNSYPIKGFWDYEA